MKVVPQQRDPYSGTTRIAMNGDIVHDPIAWTSSWIPCPVVRGQPPSDGGGRWRAPIRNPHV